MKYNKTNSNRKAKHLKSHFLITTFLQEKKWIASVDTNILYFDFPTSINEKINGWDNTVSPIQACKWTETETEHTVAPQDRTEM